MVTVEFAIVLPLLILSFMAAAEVGRYILLDMKIQASAAKVADLMTRDRDPTTASLQDTFNAVPTMLKPFDAGGRVTTMVSSVVQNDENDPPRVAWQLSGGGTLSVTSEVGQPGEDADVPGDLISAGGSALIVAEMVYDYEPWLLGLIGVERLRHVAYFRPRLSGMRSLD